MLNNLKSKSVEIRNVPKIIKIIRISENHRTKSVHIMQLIFLFFLWKEDSMLIFFSNIFLNNLNWFRPARCNLNGLLSRDIARAHIHIKWDTEREKRKINNYYKLLTSNYTRDRSSFKSLSLWSLRCCACVCVCVNGFHIMVCSARVHVLISCLSDLTEASERLNIHYQLLARLWVCLFFILSFSFYLTQLNDDDEIEIEFGWLKIQIVGSEPEILKSSTPRRIS